MFWFAGAYEVVVGFVLPFLVIGAIIWLIDKARNR